MPLQPKQLSAKEVVVAREEARPALHLILDRLLRGGAAGYLECERKLLQACETAFSTQRFIGADGRTRFERRRYIRINPEDMKHALRSCGVLLETEQYKQIRVAFSDPVGFILADPFLSAMCPMGQLPTALARALVSLLPAGHSSAPASCSVPTPSQPQQPQEQGQGNEERFVDVPDLFVDSVLRALAIVFDVEDSHPTVGDGGGSDAASATFHAGAYEEALRCFSSDMYAGGRVPGMSFVNFIAAELLLLQSNTAVSDAAFSAVVEGLPQRLAACTGQLEVAPPAPGPARSTHGGTSNAPSDAAIAAATENHDKTCSMYDFRMTHTDVPRRPHKFDYYMQHSDRRDEWLRGRDEKDAGSMYMTHAVGYGGHLPEFRSHFGRTFHVIEENLPRLTRPRPPLEPLAADAFGPGRVLKNTQMTEHHFTFA